MNQLPRIRRRGEEHPNLWQRMNARGVTPFEWFLLCLAAIAGITELLAQVAMAAARAASAAHF